MGPACEAKEPDADQKRRKRRRRSRRRKRRRRKEEQKEGHAPMSIWRPMLHVCANIGPSVVGGRCRKFPVFAHPAAWWLGTRQYSANDDDEEEAEEELIARGLHNPSLVTPHSPPSLPLQFLFPLPRSSFRVNGRGATPFRPWQSSSRRSHIRSRETLNRVLLFTRLTRRTINVCTKR